MGSRYRLGRGALRQESSWTEGSKALDGLDFDHYSAGHHVTQRQVDEITAGDAGREEIIDFPATNRLLTRAAQKMPADNKALTEPRPLVV